MANQILIPLLNPFKFVEVTPYSVPQYHTKQFDDFLYSEQAAQKWWIQEEAYCQKWQNNETAYFQFISNFDPLNAYLVGEDGSVWATINLQQISADRYHPGYYIYEGGLSFGSVPEGKYTPMLVLGDPGSPVYWKGEPIHVAEDWPDTLCLTYKNSTYFGDVIFETGVTFTMRVEGFLGKLKPGGKRNIYEDQKLNPTILSAKPFREFECGIGGSHGIPDWMIDKINWIFACDNVMIDGKLFGFVSENGTFEIKDEPDYPLRGMTITVREGLNRSSKVGDGPANPGIQYIFSYNIERRLFGDVDGDGANNTTAVLAIE